MQLKLKYELSLSLFWLYFSQKKKIRNKSDYDENETIRCGVLCGDDDSALFGSLITI